jgi:hypothetical protein
MSLPGYASGLPAKGFIWIGRPFLWLTTIAVIVAIGMNVYYSSSSLGSSLAIHLLAALTWGFSADALGRTIGGLWTPKRA